MFAPADLRAIADARARMTVTHDPAAASLFVTGLSHGAWFWFRYTKRELGVEEVAANVRYQECMTGVPNPPWHETNAAWEVARHAWGDLATVPVKPILECVPASRMHGAAAWYLAVHTRVQEFGGLTGEKERLPGLYEELTPNERAAVDARLRGEIVL